MNTRVNHNKYLNICKKKKKGENKCERGVAEKSPSAIPLLKPVDLQRRVEVDKCRPTHPKTSARLGWVLICLCSATVRILVAL